MANPARAYSTLLRLSRERVVSVFGFSVPVPISLEHHYHSRHLSVTVYQAERDLLEREEWYSSTCSVLFIHRDSLLVSRESLPLSRETVAVAES